MPGWERDAGRVSSQTLAASGSALPGETETLLRPPWKNHWGARKNKKGGGLFLSELGAVASVGSTHTFPTLCSHTRIYVSVHPAREITGSS